MEKREGWPFFPNHIMMEAFAMMILYASIVLLAAYLPPLLGEQASPLEPLIPIFPEWYFLPLFGILQYWQWGLGPITAKQIGVFLPAFFLLLLLLLPFLDKGEEARPYQRPRGIGLAVMVALGLIYLSYYTIYVEEIYQPSLLRGEPDAEAKLRILKASILLVFAAGAAVYYAIKKRANLRSHGA